MDDLQVLREFRAELPDAEPERLAGVGNRWTMAAESEKAGPPGVVAARIGGRSWLGLPRLGWGLAATGGLAVTLGLAVVLAPDGAGSVPTPPAVTTVSSTQVLLAMAAEAEIRPAEHPRPDQWIYLKKLDPHDDGSGQVRYQAVETWWRVDGTKYGQIGDSGKVEVSSAGLGGDDRSPAQFERYLQSLPTDPAALLNRIYQGTGEPAGSQREEKAFTEIVVVLRDATLMSPQVNAALLRALALIPDVRMTPDVVDVAGRHGVGISRASTDGTRDELILDGTSGAYLGSRNLVEDAAEVTIGHHESDDKGRKTTLPTVHNGDVLHAEARVTTAVVNEAGQRP